MWGLVIINSISPRMPKGRVPARRHALVLAGGAAGVAAAFNTPLAGVVFAISELLTKFDDRAQAGVSGVRRAIERISAAFGSPAYFLFNRK